VGARKKEKRERREGGKRDNLIDMKILEIRKQEKSIERTTGVLKKIIYI